LTNFDQRFELLATSLNVLWTPQRESNPCLPIAGSAGGFLYIVIWKINILRTLEDLQWDLQNFLHDLLPKRFKNQIDISRSVLSGVCDHHVLRETWKKLRKVSERHERKYTSLLKEHNILVGLRQNPNEIVTNLTGDTITDEQ
jgi:hypothetical protein